MRKTVSAVIAGLLLVAARTAAASPPGLYYEADSPCFDASSFSRLVHRAAPSIELQPATLERADVVVALRSREGATTGSLQIRRPDGSNYVREMSGASCEEVGPALAFIAALALKGADDAPPQEEPRHDEPVSPDAPAESDVATPKATTEPEPRPNAHWGLGAAAGVGIRTGLAPTWSNIEEVGVELRSLSESLLAPTLRIALLHAEPVTRIDRVGTTRFAWTAGRLGVCPLNLHPLGGLLVLPCLGIDLGVIGASGEPTGPGHGRDSSTVWGDAFGSLRLQIPVVGPVYATGEAELLIPLGRYRFAFDPDTAVFDTPLVATAVAGGLLVHFP